MEMCSKCMGDGERNFSERITYFIEVWCKLSSNGKFFVWGYIYVFIFLDQIYTIIKCTVSLVEKFFF